MKRTCSPLLLVIVFSLILTSSAVVAERIPDQPSLAPNACAPPLPGKTRDDLEGDLILAVNQIRAQRGLSKLTYNPLLRDAARAHSEDMSQNNYFSHTCSDGSTPGQRVLAAGYSWSVVGENIAAGQNNATEIVAQWSASPAHLAGRFQPILADSFCISSPQTGLNTVPQLFGADSVPGQNQKISDHLQSRWYEESPWKGPSSLVALARSLVADFDIITNSRY